MPASTRPLPSNRAAGGRPHRALCGDSQAVSEVIGYLLVFGILSMVLVLSMSAFAVGEEAAKERAVTLHAESAAARVAGVVVQTAVLWEQLDGDVAVAYLVDLPEQLEGADYLVSLVAAAGADPDLVRVVVPRFDIDVTAPVFSAAAPADLQICDSEALGGALNVRINAPSSDAVPPCGNDALFLEET
jgi:hypothetical protein